MKFFNLNLAFIGWFALCGITTLVLVNTDQRLQKERVENSALSELSRVRSEVEEIVNRYFSLVKALEAFVHAEMAFTEGNMQQDERFELKFHEFATSLEKGKPGIISLQLAPAGVVTYVSQPDRNTKAIGHDLLLDDQRREQVIRTIIERSTIVAGPLQLIQGGEALIARKAIFINKYGAQFDAEQIMQSERVEDGENWPQKIPSDFWGFATLVVDSELFFDELGLKDKPQSYDLALRGRHGMGDAGDVIYGGEKVFSGHYYQSDIRLPGGKWSLAIQPKRGSGTVRTIVIGSTGMTVFLVGVYIMRIRRTKMTAEAEAHAQGRFVAAMSHEIRTPMNGIIGVAELLEESDLSKSQRAKVEMIRANSETLLRLVNDILDYSKISMNGMELKNAPVDIRQLAADSCAVVKLSADTKGIELRCQVSENVPHQILGDAVRLQEILVNLLSNAVKFTERGHVSLSIEYRNLDGEERIIFKVTDTGIGMDGGDLERIFKPFEQLDSTTGKFSQGTGLGLVITDGLVDLMGGSILVKSERGKGSCFTVTLPHRPANANETGLAQERQLSEMGRTSESHLVQGLDDKTAGPCFDILVVDDAEINQKVALMLLSRYGHQADIVESAAEAIASVKKKSYDMIYMDRQMPEMDGLEATRKIRAMTGSATTPWIVGLTASAQDEQREEFMKAGANDFLSKPISKESISRTIRAYEASETSR